MNTLRNKATLVKKSFIRRGHRSLAFLGTLVGISLLVISGCGDDNAANTNTNTGTSGAPNLVVRLATIDNATVTQNETVTLSLEVQNTGTVASGEATVTFYQSTDDDMVSITDPALDGSSSTIPAIAPKEKSAKVTFEVPTATIGTFYYGACVGVLAQEDSRNDNCATAAQLTVNATPQPNLTVSVSFTTSSVLQNTATTLQATVRNTGNANSSAATLTFYRSTDATVDGSAPTDTALASGTRTIAVLADDVTSAQTIEIPATASTGTFNYGACVTVLSEESDSTDNCDATTLEVTATPLPDLVPVGAPTFDAMSYENGATITVRARLTNSGTANSRAGASVKFYRVNDGDDDVLVATVSDIAIIGADLDSAVVEATFTATTPVGTQQYYFVVAGMSGETNTGNNTSARVSVVITAPDLVPVGPPTFGVASYVSGTTVTIRAQLRNSGTADSSVGASVKFYLEAGASDVLVATGPNIAAITAGGTSPVIEATFAATTQNAPVGTQQYYFVIGGVTMSGEINTDNNTSATSSVTITAPDLVPAIQTGQTTNVPTFGVASYVSGTTVTIRAQLRNSGTANSGVGASVKFYLQTGASPVLVDTVSGIAAIVAGATGPVIEVTFPALAPKAPVGTQQYYFVIEGAAMSGETNISNNTSALGSVAITAPDLVPVGAPTFGVASYVNGSTVTIQAQLRNSGTADSIVGASVKFYREAGASDVLVATVSNIAAIAANADSAVIAATFTASVPVGVQQYYFVVEGVSSEVNTGNNTSALGSVTITAPDLTITAATIGRLNEVAGNALGDVSVTVRNGGDAPSPATTMGFQITNGGTPVDLTPLVTVPMLAPGAQMTFTPSDIIVPSATTPATYVLQVAVVAVAGEVTTTNNTRVITRTLAVGVPSDLIIQSFAIGTTTVASGGTFMPMVVVRNDGLGASGHTTFLEFQLRKISDNTLVATLTGSISVPVLATATNSASLSGPITVSSSDGSTVPVPAGTYHITVVVGQVAGESDATNNSVVLGGTATPTVFTIN